MADEKDITGDQPAALCCHPGASHGNAAPRHSNSHSNGHRFADCHGGAVGHADRNGNRD